jgi:hypothetical protein
VARSGGPELLRRRRRATGVEMRPIHSGTSAERGKPVVLPVPYPMGSRESNPQGAPTGQQVKEEGGSECRPVMGRIGVATSPYRESGQTSLWSGVTREPGQQTSGGDADMSAAETLAGAVPNLATGLSAPGEYREGLFRQAAAARVCTIRSPRGTIHLFGGSRTPPRPTGK